MKTNQQGPLYGLCRFNPEAATEVIIVFSPFWEGKLRPTSPPAPSFVMHKSRSDKGHGQFASDRRRH